MSAILKINCSWFFSVNKTEVRLKWPFRKKLRKQIAFLSAISYENMIGFLQETGGIVSIELFSMVLKYI